MAGCRSCSSCSSEKNYSPVNKAEKLEKMSWSRNPRYPLVFVGKQAIYSDENAQVIVTVLNDCCDETRDCFTLKPQRILKDSLEKHSVETAFEVTQPAGEHAWRLQALI
jgi:hypothetical protein